MNKLTTLTLSILLVMVMMSNHAFAGGNTYAVGVQIKNLDTTTAAIVSINYYNESDGSLENTLPVTIPAGDSFTMATLDGVDADFDGSAVVSADREIAAIANVFANGFSGMGASYSAFSGGASSANLPLILRDHYGFNTWFKVQNTGTSATTVTVTYNNNATETATIQPGAAKTFDQASNTSLTDPDTNSSAGFVGSATVSAGSGGSIVATLLQQGPTTLLGYDSFSDANASTNPAMPLINMNNYGYITGIQIQNTGTQATNVTVSYTASLVGNDCTETKSVPAGESKTFTLGAFSATSEAGENCGNDETFVGSASVTSNSTNQPLVAIVNQLNVPASKGASYGGFNPTNGTSTVVLPLIMDRNYGYFTGFSIVNVGGSSAQITCSYTNSSVTNSETVPAGEALTIVNGNALAPGYVGGATCTTSGSIVGIVNELNTGAGSDSFLVYEGTNQ